MSAREEFRKDLGRIALGFWRAKDGVFAVDQIRDLVALARDHGISAFDHADAYAPAEEQFGEATDGFGSARDEVHLLSKVTIVYPGEGARVKYYDTSRDHIVGTVESSLRALRTDYLDTLLLHRPNPRMDPEATAAAFSELKAAGKVRFFGVSNYLPHQFDMLQSFCDMELVTDQVQASVMCHENFDNGVFDHALQHRYAPMVWSPLAGGRIFTGTDEASRRVREALQLVAPEIGATTIDEAAIAWLVSHPAGLCVITGGDREEYITRASAGTRLGMTDEQWFLVWSAFTGVKVP